MVCEFYFRDDDNLFLIGKYALAKIFIFVIEKKVLIEKSYIGHLREIK